MKLSIGERIRDCRKNINLTQEELAEKLCVSFQTVSRWENGNSYPDIEVLPQLSQLFDVTMDYLFGNEGKQREDRANEEFDKAMEYLDTDSPDKKKAYELIHNLRVDFPDHNRLAHLFIFVFSNKLWKDPDILYELRLIAENLLGNPKTPKWVKDEVVWYMCAYETDELFTPFIDRYTTENRDLRRSHLLLQRYRARDEHEKAEFVKQCILYETINEICTGGWWRKCGKPNDVNLSKWGNDIGFALLNSICRTGNDPKYPVSGDGNVDVFFAIRIIMGFRKACYHATLGEKETAYGVLEDTVSLLEKGFSLENGTELTADVPYLDVFKLKIEYFEELNHGTYAMQCICPGEESGIYIGEYADLSLYRRILAEPKGWEWFNPIRDEERYKKYIERIDNLIKHHKVLPPAK